MIMQAVRVNDPEAGGQKPAQQLEIHAHDHQVREALSRLEQRLEPLLSAAERAAVVTGAGVAREMTRGVPAWRRVSAGELRWPVSVVVAGMIALQVSLPDHLTMTGKWLLPGIEAALGLVLMISNPRRMSRRSPMLRSLGLLLAATASLANGWSAVRLIAEIVSGSQGSDAVSLLVTAGNIWITNVIVFGLWYWELDRGGPAARAMASMSKPDFLFPEMTAPELTDPGWEPTFVDYLYVAFTNATAFSPTDTLPFSRWSKLAMMLQSTISLATGVLVIARAVNILPS